ncbi:MAG: CDP-alcohol phosphatidyltransferase family protein [Planctomycetota bacterium]
MSRRERRRLRPRVRDRAKKGLALLPSLLTLANMVCGFYAIVHVGAVDWVDGEPLPANSFLAAAVAILIAMVFDMLDGRVARMTNSTSDFGAQLDSLADAITFGVAPGVIVAMLHAMGRYNNEYPLWSRMAWVFGAAYACGAVVRLARFNVHTESHDEEAHLWFKGLPSPAAAGVIASLVLVNAFFLSERGNHRLSWIEPNTMELVGHVIVTALPFVALGIGYLMVSQFRYVHFANAYLRGRKPADYLVAVIFLGALGALVPEISLAIIFCGFALTGPLRALRAYWRGETEPEPRADSGAVLSLNGSPPQLPPPAAQDPHDDESDERPSRPSFPSGAQRREGSARGKRQA